MIRTARADDVNEIHEIQKKNFSQPWSKEQIKEELEKKNTIQFVFEDNRIIIAYLLCTRVDSEIEIISLAVDKMYHRKGVASQLVNYLLKQVIKNSVIFLEVNENNQKAIVFYQGHGFDRIAKRKSYYQDGSDAIIMKRHC